MFKMNRWNIIICSVKKDSCHLPLIMIVTHERTLYKDIRSYTIWKIEKRLLIRLGKLTVISMKFI